MKQKNVTQLISSIFLFILMASVIPVAQSDQLENIDMAQKWGVEPVHLRVTAGGYMIEFRYKVLDIDKALILSDRKEFPYLLSMKSRAKLSIPYGSTVGFLKSNRRFMKEGKHYIAMFSNEGQHMLKGDKVKIQIRNQVSPELVLQ